MGKVLCFVDHEFSGPQGKKVGGLPASSFFERDLRSKKTTKKLFTTIFNLRVPYALLAPYHTGGFTIDGTLSRITRTL